MWQTVNLTEYVDAILIDSSLIKFNLSAWMGGILNQDDSAEIVLTFFNGTNQFINNSTRFRPILAVNRGGITRLMPRVTSGEVPVKARSLTLLVSMTRYVGSWNNGDVDNIALHFYV